MVALENLKLSANFGESSKNDIISEPYKTEETKENNHNTKEKALALFKIYIQTIEDYSSRGLTFPTDTLPAISALVSRFSIQLGAYYAGIFQSYFMIGLQWEALDTFESKRYTTYVAPSFSWASREGAVIWYLHSDQYLTEESHEWPELLGMRCSIMSKD